MSKFEELCQTYAAARKESLESRKACQDFADVFVKCMSDYFECPIEKHKIYFDEQGLMHFQVSLTLYENPSNTEDCESEIVLTDLSIEKIIDNYIVTIYPWGKDWKIFWDEFSKFEEVYEFIFEKIKDAYRSGISLLPPENNEIRKLGWEF